MGQIVNKLNLNRVPQLIDNNSLIFAKNVRLSANGFSPDYGFDKISDTPFRKDEIVGIIPYNTKFYIFLYYNGTSEIKVYDEQTNDFTHIACNWNYSGGKIDGICTTNLNGDTLLTIAEYDADGKQVPLKVININESDDSDDESIYTQSPKVPFINLIQREVYKNVIPAGTYQFFVRYEIRKDFYTNWFPASKELFAGCKKTLRTNQGGLSYIDINIDSDFSFILDVEQPIKVQGYKSFQLGFIIAHDDEVYARAYKHYALDTTRIHFDYDTEYIEEIDVRDILESPYLLYNVKNVTSFKNKLYISNYIESDVNPDLESFAQSVNIELSESQNEARSTFEGRDIVRTVIDGDQYISGIKLNDLDAPINDSDSPTITNIIEYALNTNKGWIFGTETGSDNSDSKTFNVFGVKVNFAKCSTKINTSSEPDTPNGYIYDDVFTPTIYGEESGESIPWEGDIPTIRQYEITKQPVNTSQVSSIEDDIIAFILNNVSYIKIDTGKIVDNEDNEVSFRLTYYTQDDINQNIYYKHIVVIVFNIDQNAIVLDYKLNNQYTLVPNQGYYFYLHLVRNNGEATNGYLINNVKDDTLVPEPFMVPEPTAQLPLNDFPAIYPRFTFNRNLPEGYVACFISIAHVKNKVAHVFDISNAGADVYTEHLGSCLELDTRLYTWLNDIPVQKGDNTFVMDYRASYDSDYLLTFGGAGECVFKEALPADMTYGFIVMPYEAKPEYIASIKCTPFIVFDASNEAYTYDQYEALNLPGYLCRVKKPLRNYNITHYFSGSDIYLTGRSKDEHDNYKISLAPLEDSASDWGKLYDSEEFTIYSNFNLNYLALTDNISPRLTTKTSEDNGTSIKTTHLILFKDSSILSEIYKLSSMYKSYTRKLYYPYDTYNKLTKFDNTIRSSILEGDENKVNMYRFRPTDYYNVPTDKGIIVNLVAVGDNILVHTQDSIYKFTGYNSLTAAGGEDVQMKESEPFDTGIQELFGSEFGYAGLQNKKHQVLSEMGYTFYDSDGQRIYYYTGNANIKVISDDVSKLFKYKHLKDIYFADDYYNNRVFVCLDFGDDKYATLTYDFTAKCFISLHDFHFDWAFKTKTKCYFVTPERNNIYKVSDTNIADYPSEFAFIDKLYPTGANKECIIDVIYNDEFETIKTLNAISWVCNKVKDFLEETNNTTEDMLVAEEWFDYKHAYKGEVLRLYSDSVKTPAIDIAHETHDKSNDYSIQQVASYDRPRYNLGKWTFNYFRNILNRVEDPTLPRVFGEQDTLLYGKYFVARFIFNRSTNFKIEDVTFEISNDYNV